MLEYFYGLNIAAASYLRKLWLTSTKNIATFNAILYGP